MLNIETDCTAVNPSRGQLVRDPKRLATTEDKLLQTTPKRLAITEDKLLQTTPGQSSCTACTSPVNPSTTRCPSETGRCLIDRSILSIVTPEVRRTDPEGIDYGWVMQVTFVLTIVLGAPLIALLSVLASVPTWGDRAVFAVQVGAPIWFVTALCVYGYARRRQDRSASP